ncbi:MAG TPA: AsmA-like C-terminal domain-containing protein [Candidatus Binataceae bacterium]|nr:AsmA-like C-terminal domain-containing protein [Candidatus Binataceae bacterium]
MRRLLTVIGAIVGVVVLAIIALFLYAYFNLNSIIASNRGYIVTRASDALGRPVVIQDIRAAVGWGVKIDVSGVKVADDPSFSQLPFLQASDVYVNVELLPLLSRSLKITKLEIKQPELRVIRNRAGTLNVATIGAKTAPAQTPTPATPNQKTQNVAGLAALTVGSLKIDDGTLSYTDQQSGGPPIQLNDFNLAVDNFNVNSPFDVTMSLAALGKQQDLAVSGKVGPLMHAGTIQTNSVPLNLDATIGPIAIAQLRTLPQLAHAIPAGFSISQPITVYAKITGTSDAPNVNANADLTSSQVVYAGTFNKPANVPFKFNGSVSSAGGVIRVNRADLLLATLKATATNLILEKNNIAARIDTNKFDVGGIGKLLVMAEKYNLSGNAEVHTDVRMANHQPSANGTVTFTNINATLPGSSTPPLSDLTGTIQMAGNSGKVGPIQFKLGSKPARLQAVAQSLQPLRATYQFNAAVLNVGDLVPSRRSLGEHVDQLAANGNLSRTATGALSASTNLSSASGMAANVPYQNLTLAALYQNDRLTINSLKLNTFDGTIGASGLANLTSDRNFNLKLTAANLNVQKALTAEKSKAAGILRGFLTGNIQVAGAGSNFDQIKPTLHGNGGANLKNGKLVGVNVVAQAMQKVDNLPAIGALVPASVVARHPELFKSNDTDVQNANLTFTLQGPRMTTHDLTVAAADYSLLGDGWFDMDKNVNLVARILLSKSLSSELIAAKHNIAYIANPDQRIEIPLRVAGQLPKPAILPDVTVLAQRAATHAAQREMGKFLNKKGGAIGGLLGGGSKGSSAPSGNPLNQFKGLFK